MGSSAPIASRPRQIHPPSAPRSTRPIAHRVGDIREHASVAPSSSARPIRASANHTPGWRAASAHRARA